MVKARFFIAIIIPSFLFFVYWNGFLLRQRRQIMRRSKGVKSFCESVEISRRGVASAFPYFNK
jgi:hypothetical protein